MYLEIFLADFAGFRGISRKYLNFAGLRLREISEALSIGWSENKIRNTNTLHQLQLYNFHGV